MRVRPENCAFDMQQTVGELPLLDRAWAWFVVNRKQVLYGGATLLVVALAISIYFWRKLAVEVSAGDALSRAEAQFGLPGGPRNESSEPYLKVANEHPGTGAGARALLQAGAVLFTQAKYAEAQALFQRFARDYPGSSLGGQALLGNAACLDALAKTDEAAAAYKSVSEQHPGEPAANQAKFALARIYETQGKLDQARLLYEDVARAEANTSMGNEAGLKADELRAKAPPIPLTNAPPPLVTTTTAPVVTAPAPSATSSVPVLSTPPAVTTNAP